VSEPVRTLRVEVSEWPDAQSFDPANPKYQWDVYVGGEWVMSGTGPGDALDSAHEGLDTYRDVRDGVRW
jgi:hypothetical protein